MKDHYTKHVFPAAAIAGWSWLAVIVIVLLCCCTASGAPRESVCRVENRAGNARSLGSGTLVHTTDDRGEGLILTCAHLFREGTGELLVTFADGRSHGAKLVEIDHQADLAALAIARPAAEPVEIAPTVDRGATLRACGFGPGGRYRCAVGPVVGQASDVGQVSLMIADGVRSGDSGGGVFDEQGRLVAVIWGEAGGVTYASSGAPLQSFLARVLGRVKVARFSCPDGSCRRPAFGSGSARRSPVLQVPPDPGREIVADSRLSDLAQRIDRLENEKQDRGDYLTRADLGRYVSTEELRRVESEGTQRHASLLDRLGSLGAMASSAAGTGLGTAAIGALGISGPVGWGILAATSLGGILLGRQTQRKASGAGGRRGDPFQK